MSADRQHWKKRVVKRSLGALGVVLALGFACLSALAAWISRDLPDPNSLSTRDVAQSTKIFDRSGKTLLYEIHGNEKRTLVSIRDIPDTAKWATVAIEDRKFYEHHGVYWRGLFRAGIMSIIKWQRLQGTSTLTQQLIKNAILTNERSVMRKFKEFILAVQMERIFTKDQILQLYFNEIPYGSTIYGIESAAQSYFGKPVKSLSLDEAALLAAIPQRPDFYSPYGTGRSGDNRDRLVVRQHYILDLMVEQGKITPTAAQEAKKTETLKKLTPKKMGDIHAPHFVMYVKGLLEEKYGQRQVEQAGLRVITTLDATKQDIAEEEVRRGVERRGKTYGFTNAALISLDPKNGQVLAMVGSKDFFDIKNDGMVNVTLRPRQPGSSFKPIVYAVGFRQGYLPQTELWDVNTTFRADVGVYKPHNYDGKERGPVTIRRALQNSLNTPAVKMLYLVGVGRVLDFAEQLGYTTFGNRSRFALSLVLGGGEVKPIEHASAFAAFANDGSSMPTTSILRVEDSKGTILDEWRPSKGKRVMEPSVARTMNGVLSDVGSRTEIFGEQNSLGLPDRPVAAKTGTTNNFRDAWTAGYTPNLVTVVWVGNNDGNTNMKSGADGSVVAAPIWQAFMKRALRNVPKENFIAPEPTFATKTAILGQVTQQTIKVDKISGKRASEFTPPDLIEERSFFEAHSILHYINKNDPTGPAPENPANDPQYAYWENAVQDWVLRNAWHTTNTAPTEVDDVHTAENRPQVNVTSPIPLQELAARQFNIEAAVSAPRPVVRIEAIIDGVLLGTAASAPWIVHAQIPINIQSGSHRLLVSAVDDVGNRGEVAVPITLSAPQTSMTGAIHILEPVSGSAWPHSSFPRAISFAVDDPSALTHTDVSFIGADGIKLLVTSERVDGKNMQIRLPFSPPAGIYQLSLAAYNANGLVDETAVQVIITEP